MPRAHKTYDAIPKLPIEYLQFQVDEKSEPILFQVFQEKGTDRELICCDLCYQHLPLTSKRSLVTLTKHRGKGECTKLIDRKEKGATREEAVVGAESDKVFTELFPTPGKGQSESDPKEGSHNVESPVDSKVEPRDPPNPRQSDSPENGTHTLAPESGVAPPARDPVDKISELEALVEKANSERDEGLATIRTLERWYRRSCEKEKKAEGAREAAERDLYRLRVEITHEYQKRIGAEAGVSNLRADIERLQRDCAAQKSAYDKDLEMKDREIKELEENLASIEDKNMLFCQLRVDAEVDKLEEILASEHLKESDQQIRLMLEESHRGLRQIVRECKAARPPRSNIIQKILPITKREISVDEEDEEGPTKGNKAARLA